MLGEVTAAKPGPGRGFDAWMEFAELPPSDRTHVGSFDGWADVNDERLDEAMQRASLQQLKRLIAAANIAERSRSYRRRAS
jgi:hypothetical protein